MSNCLGIYAENNIIKYAKLTTGKDGGSLKLATYGVRFSDNKKETIKQIVQETNSTSDFVATNIIGETYENVEVFSKLNKKDTKELVNSEFVNICDTNGTIPSVLDMRFRLSKNTGDSDKYKAICVSTYKSELANIFQEFSDSKINSVAPLGTSIVNILPSKGVDTQAAIVNIEEETVVTILSGGEIVEIKSFPIGMKDVLPKLAEKYNSYSKAYEACKGVSAYIEDIYSLEDSDREVLDLLIPMLYELRQKIEQHLKPYMPAINKIYLSGSGIIINNLDLYFQEVFTDKTCELLVPYFLQKDSNSLKDIVEVNTAIALAFNGIGYNDKEMDYMFGGTANQVQSEALKKKATEIWDTVKVKAKEFVTSSSPARLKAAKKKKIDIDFNDEVIDTDDDQPSVQFGEEDTFEDDGNIAFFTPTEAWMARFAGATLLSFCLYSGAAYYTQSVISNKRAEVSSESAKVNGWISEAKADTRSVDEETQKYVTMKNNLSELLNKVTTRNVSFDIPNFMSKLMFVIPENVKVTSISVIPTTSADEKTSQKVTMYAESGQYAQLGYFVSRLKLDKVLTNVDMSVESMSGNIKIKINGELP